jgi:S-formylglutathione hydrolase FrmB
MSRRAIALLIAAIAATACLWAGTPSTAQPRLVRTAAPPRNPLQLVHEQHLSARLSELTFTTPALSGPTRVRVLVPDRYDTSGRTRYPVLYLLHGGTGSYRDWTDQGDAAAITAGFPLIVVMPDTGPNNGYLDWYNGGAGGPPMWETYHLTQLLPWIDAHYPTVGTRAGRAIAGLSMGGGGSMVYTARHPDLFGAAASFSGAVDTNVPAVWPLVEAGNWDGHLGVAEGHRVTDEVRWRGHNAWDLAENLGDLSLLQVDTGNGLPGGPGRDIGDPIEGAVHEMNVDFNARLDQLGIAHIWDDYGAGGHNWFYWKRDLRQFLPRLMQALAAPRPAPTSFTYKTIEANYVVYDWQVEVLRPALEFSRLVTNGRDGFSLTGSGRALVTTAPLFEPGQWVDAELRNSAGVQRVELRADGSGRLLVPVLMGAGNPYQQYTAQATAWQAINMLVDAPGSLFDPNLQWPTFTATVRLFPAN